MNCVNIFAICLISVFSIHGECSVGTFDSNAKFVVIQNVTAHLNANPEIKLHSMSKVERYDKISNKIEAIHKFGSRVSGKLFSEIIDSWVFM